MTIYLPNWWKAFAKPAQLYVASTSLSAGQISLAQSRCAAD